MTTDHKIIQEEIERFEEEFRGELQDLGDEGIAASYEIEDQKPKLKSFLLSSHQRVIGEIVKMVEEMEGLTEHEKIVGGIDSGLELARRKLKIDILSKLKQLLE